MPKCKMKNYLNIMSDKELDNVLVTMSAGANDCVGFGLSFLNQEMFLL